jgi:hypothetical protein
MDVASDNADGNEARRAGWIHHALSLVTFFVRAKKVTRLQAEAVDVACPLLCI